MIAGFLGALTALIAQALARRAWGRFERRRPCRWDGRRMCGRPIEDGDGLVCERRPFHHGRCGLDR